MCGNPRPHIEPKNRQTLVIDTTNFSTHRTFRQTQGLEVSGEHVHLVERLAPIDADTIR
jgi:hypothetical protein